MENKNNEQQLTPAQDHLMDIFATINFWASKGKHQAFVFLCDGKDYLLFSNRHEELWCNLPMAVCADPKMAAMFDSLYTGVEALRASMCEDEPDFKALYDSVQSMQDLPDYFLYGEDLGDCAY